MPIYEYSCGKCKTIFSLLQKISSSEKDTVCPKCGSKDVKKKFSVISRSSSCNSPETFANIPSFRGGS